MQEIMDLYTAFHTYQINRGMKFIQAFFRNSRVSYGKASLSENVHLLCVTSRKLSDIDLKKTTEGFIISHAASIITDCDLSAIPPNIASNIFLDAFQNLGSEPHKCFNALERYINKSEHSKEMLNEELEAAINTIDWNKIGVQSILDSDALASKVKINIIRLLETGISDPLILPIVQTEEEPPQSEKEQTNLKFLKGGQSNLNKLYQNSESQDCTFAFPTGSTVKAHKIVLAMNSDVFYTMFYGPMKEQGTVKIPDIDQNVFELMMK